MDIRKKFIEFFEQKDHKVIGSAPLVPDDTTLLFTNAGMVQFKSIFAGLQTIPNPPRAVSCQTCLRAGGKHNDLDNVGYTSRHHTFFEMLGNFSFGDYFKQEAIAYAWEFVTKELALDVRKLYVTVHNDDDEAYKMWQAHVDKERIYRFGDKDNFWQMGDTGPCGPCSEIFYDQGEEFDSPEDVMGGEGDRFLEIWNLVFMQYDRDKEGNLNPLPKPSIDTGMGLERVQSIIEGTSSNYESSLFMPIIKEVERLVQKPYVYESGASYRVIADHIRATTFLLSQGVNFDKEGRGYVLRRILRRAVRHGYMLGLNEPFMYKLVDIVCELMGSHYEYLNEKKSYVKELIFLEEERFFATISEGIELFNKELEHTTQTFSGEVAFKLYDTYGFPLDLTQDMLREKGIALDVQQFELLMQQQRQRAKAAQKQNSDSANSGDFKKVADAVGINEFVGYEHLQYNSNVVALFDSEFKSVQRLDDAGWVMLDKTPFYAQSGGQKGDCGALEDVATVEDTQNFFGLNISKIEPKRALAVGDGVKAIVSRYRKEIERHHSATHILHQVLKEVLGEHVAQAGSLVEANRLRFDFSHPKAVTQTQIQTIEDSVNQRVMHAHAQTTEIMDIEAAKQKGAMALFDQKYDDKVRVVGFGDVSLELCGGTHVNNTSEIGLFVITKESGVSAGVRRIEACVSQAAYEYFKQTRTQLQQVQNELKNSDVLAGINKLKEQIKGLKEEIKVLQSAEQQNLQSQNINGIEIVITQVEGGNIKDLVDDIKNRYDSVAAMLFMKKGDKVLIAAGSKNAPIKAGQWVKQIAPILGGGGGGRDDFAQAGGKDASKIEQAIKAAQEYIQQNL
ncbi:MAG: alanine--tRNA ligase [Campylobacterota bacterium]